MSKSFVNAIGLMSGTSLDGLDIVYVQFDKDDFTRFKIHYSETVNYSKEWKEKLATAIFKTSEEIDILNDKYGLLLSEKVNNFIKKNKITKIDFIASHGHTILHQPEKGITLQIGNGQIIANQTGQKVVCDFRTQDVKLGGQGAPLVPIGDEFLFSQYEACLNLGGFANVSYRANDERIAFDICPVNIVLNHYVNQLGFEYDDKGKLASEGRVNKKLLEELNSLQFYTEQPPKSLGLEWVQKNIFPLINSYEIVTKDILRTFVEHLAFQIAVSLKNKKTVLITGGGVFNQFLIDRIRFYADSEIKIPIAQLVNYKEALIFAFLGWLRIENKVNCLRSVTGAKYNHSSGKVFIPLNR